MNASDRGNALQKALRSAEVSEFWFGMAVFPKSIRCRPRLFGLTAISCPLLCFDSTRKYCKKHGQRLLWLCMVFHPSRVKGVYPKSQFSI